MLFLDASELLSAVRQGGWRRCREDRGPGMVWRERDGVIEERHIRDVVLDAIVQDVLPDWKDL